MGGPAGAWTGGCAGAVKGGAELHIWVGAPERAASAACTAGSGLCVSHCNSSGGVPGFAAIAGWRSERDPAIRASSAKEVWGFQAATRSGSTPVV